MNKIGEPLFSVRYWIALSGLSIIIIGLFSFITVIGMLFGFLFVTMGIYLIAAAKNLSKSRKEESEDKQNDELRNALQKIKVFFIIFGLINLFFILLIVIFIALGVVMQNQPFFMMGEGHMNNWWR